MDMFDPDFCLQTDDIQLRIIRPSDLEAFREIIFETATWNFYPVQYQTNDDLENFIEQSVFDFKNKTRCPLATLDRSTQKIIGSTSFGNISPRDQRLEIGWSWLCAASRGRGVNKQAKFLQLQHAFSQMRFQRVEFKTDVLNIGARKALSKIGAVEEGVLRSHTQMHSARRRDTIFYSILFDEWETVRCRYFPELVDRKKLKFQVDGRQSRTQTN